MGNTFAFAGRTGMFLMACVAAITVPSCSTNDGPDPNIQELEKRGFQEVVKADADGTGNVYFATVGSCRVRLVYTTALARWTAQNGKDDNGPTKVDNPTADAIRNLPAYDYCSKKPAPSVSPTSTP